MFNEFWADEASPDLVMEKGQMVGYMAPEGLRWKVECVVLL